METRQESDVCRGLRGAVGDGDEIRTRHWLDRGANPNFRIENGDALLHEAIFWREATIVNILLARGADPKLRDTSGKTPTELARAEGRGDIVDLLYVYGAEW